ncbi:MAG: hypothetical protein JWP48_2355 [Actinoallomurus sp.]|jgi:hypothetical protein|nr:hypothetical protein [Actinoallomurus sp.]
MAETPKLALDQAGLQNFIDTQILPFRDSLTKIKTVDNDQGQTMRSLVGNGKIDDTNKDLYGLQKPLTIGQMTKVVDGGDPVKGGALANALTDAANSIDKVYEQQVKLFNDLHENLQKTITKLMQGQTNSLTLIDGKAFLDNLGTVPSDFQATGNGNSAS